VPPPHSSLLGARSCGRGLLTLAFSYGPPNAIAVHLSASLHVPRAQRTKSARARRFSAGPAYRAAVRCSGLFGGRYGDVSSTRRKNAEVRPAHERRQKGCAAQAALERVAVAARGASGGDGIKDSHACTRQHVGFMSAVDVLTDRRPPRRCAHETRSRGDLMESCRLRFSERLRRLIFDAGKREVEAGSFSLSPSAMVRRTSTSTGPRRTRGNASAGGAGDGAGGGCWDPPPFVAGNTVTEFGGAW